MRHYRIPSEINHNCRCLSQFATGRAQSFFITTVSIGVFRNLNAILLIVQLLDFVWIRWLQSVMRQVGRMCCGWRYHETVWWWSQHHGLFTVVPRVITCGRIHGGRHCCHAPIFVAIYDWARDVCDWLLFYTSAHLVTCAALNGIKR